jgi:GTP-binding protein HflX
MADRIKRAVLVAVHLPDVDDLAFNASLEEMTRLVATLGYVTVGTVTQARPHIERAAVLGAGKLKELGEVTGGKGVLEGFVSQKKRAATPEPARTAPEEKIDLVAVDHDLSPSQARNLESVVGCQVLDRTGVIIEIFHRHAKSREARLQVEIARLKYEAPRLRESPGGKERQQGRGAGEAALELDRRKIRDRVSELRDELAAVQRDQEARRSHRRDARRVALVGYTNAGKSSLMRALTGSEVYVENKLFATLDTTVRALQPEAKPRILVSDTVGFIKKLPHDLVASFKSTLDEALEASHVLHVVDAADPAWEAHYQVTCEVLAEIGAATVPTTLVMNKRDRLTPESLAALRARWPEAWFVSAHDPSDIAVMHDRIVAVFAEAYVEEELFVPYSRQAVLSEMHAAGGVAAQRYEESGIFVTYRGGPETVARFKARLASTLPAIEK